MTTNIMTPEEFAKRMIELKEEYDNDKEARHIMMDGLLCGVLASLGYYEGVKVFNDTDMWYA